VQYVVGNDVAIEWDYHKMIMSAPMKLLRR
jgi:hypothetical protein